MSDSVHKTHFPITKDMPWREKEKQAVLLLQELIDLFKYNTDYYYRMSRLLDENKDLVGWVMKYKGE